MSVRDDITVDWSASPRIIEVALPSTEISLQDLHDTLRVLASQPEAMDKDEIIDSDGKKQLDETTLTGLTVSLLNARLKFADRVSPPYISCTVSGGNLTAVDVYGNMMNPIEPSAYTQVTRALSSSATLTTQEELQTLMEQTQKYVMSML